MQFTVLVAWKITFGPSLHTCHPPLSWFPFSRTYNDRHLILLINPWLHLPDPIKSSFLKQFDIGLLWTKKGANHASSFPYLFPPSKKPFIFKQNPSELLLGAGFIGGRRRRREPLWHDQRMGDFPTHFLTTDYCHRCSKNTKQNTFYRSPFLPESFPSLWPNSWPTSCSTKKNDFAFAEPCWTSKKRLLCVLFPSIFF